MPGQAKELGAGGLLRTYRREVFATFKDNINYVDQGLDVIYECGFSKETDLGGKRRLVARLTAKALDGVEKRGFLAANVRSGAAPDFNIKGYVVSQRSQDPEDRTLACLENSESLCAPKPSGYSPRR